ncbi:MAG: CobD/CbiB family protein [Azonexus sp.]|nr:CobD/CbiB family protein [Azonexus sp.]
MSLLSLIAVFLIEQLQPLNYRRVVEEPLAAWADFIESHFNAGEYRQGVIAWCLAVLLPVLLVALLYGLLYSVTPILALLFNIGILYLTMGFRQFSHHYTEIHLALRLGDLPRARHLLAEWRGRSADDLGSQEIARLTIETALAASHRHVFGVLLCFVLLPGPCGAVLYRMAAVIKARWQRDNAAEHNDFSTFSRQVFGIIDWLPLRATASAFAIVGDFEDAVYCWRTQAGQWPDRDLGIVLASGAGALGVQLGMPLAEGVEVSDGAELGVGDPADVDFMQSAVGLVWRATVLWMLLLFLLEFASLVG